MSNFRAQGLGVDDDNEPAEENIPSTNDTEDVIWKDWTCDVSGACARKSNGHLKRLSSHSIDMMPSVLQCYS